MLWNALLLAVREIRRNVLRSFLTILGIVIGVAAVITMVTLGNGVTAKVAADISKLGSNMLIVRTGQHMGPGGGRQSADPFEMDDVEAIRNEVGSLAAVAPSSSQSSTIIYANQSWSTTVTGTTNEYLIVRDWDIESGRSFQTGEQHSGKAVCILGATVRKELFGGRNPLGSQVRLGKLTCQVVGVLEAKGGSGMGHDQDDVVLVPLRTFQRRLSGNRDISNVMVSVRDGAPTEKAQADIEALMRERRRIVQGKSDDFQVRDMKEITTMVTGTTQTLTALLGAVAAVSLLVGGIGIMNIMLVSVTERTREIGIRMAIGALEREVLMQFLVEAIVLSSLGGILGITLALLGSLKLSGALGVPFVLDVNIVLIAFGFSALVGVVFGFFPARRAAMLDPIDALRHE